MWLSPRQTGVGQLPPSPSSSSSSSGTGGQIFPSPPPASQSHQPRPPPPGQLNLMPNDPYREVPILNQRGPLLGLIITLIVSAWICSLLRLYTRLHVQRAPGWDDFFVILALLLTTLGSVVLCAMTNMGLGKPIMMLNLVEFQNILKYIYIATATYALSSAFIKISLLLQYIRAFTGKKIRLFCKIMIAITSVNGAAFAICSWFSCYPVAAFWDFSIRNAKCWGFASRNNVEFITISIVQVAVTNILDMVVFIIPTWLYFQPSTPRNTRLSLLCLLVLGLSAILCSLWRLVYVAKLRDRNSFDPTWDNPTIMGLASFEVLLAAICAALPILWPVIKTAWNRILVTYEVSVTQEDGTFPLKKANDMELQSPSLERTNTGDPSQHSDTWEPFVGDETTGLGTNETTVESLAKQRKKMGGNVI